MRADRSALAALALLSTIWGYTWILMKQGLQFAGPFDFIALRTAVATLILFGVLLARRQRLRPSAIGPLVWLGLTQTAGFLACSNWALVSGAAGKTAVIVYTYPFWTLLAAWPLLGERVRGGQWVAIALAACGLVLVIEPWHRSGTPTSELLALATGLSWVAASIIGRRLQLHSGMDLTAVTAWQMLFGAIALCLLAAAVPSRPIEWTGYFIFVMLFTTLVSTVGGSLLWLYALARIPAGTATLTTLAVPVIGVALSRLQLGEQPGAVEVAGMLLICASLALLAWMAVARAAGPPPAQ